MYGELIVGRVNVAEFGPHSITTVIVCDMNSPPPFVLTFISVVYVFGEVD